MILFQRPRRGRRPKAIAQSRVEANQPEEFVRVPEMQGAIGQATCNDTEREFLLRIREDTAP